MSKQVETTERQTYICIDRYKRKLIIKLIHFRSKVGVGVDDGLLMNFVLVDTRRNVVMAIIHTFRPVWHHIQLESAIT